MTRLGPLRGVLRAVTLVGLAGGAANVFSCAGSEVPEARSPAARPPPAGPGTGAASEDAGVAVAAEADEFGVAELDRLLLYELEARGFAFASLVFGDPARTTLELNRLPGVKDIFDVLRADVRGTLRSQPLAKVTSMDGFRLFDERWLASNEMKFALTGVFNRLDRRAFYPGTCGEIRFVYRLAYRTEHAGSAMAGRLPLTVNVVFMVNGEGGCGDVARAWRLPRGKQATSRLDWLVGEGPLAPAQRARWELKSIETNLQSFRLQSFVHPTLAGHIDYVLRVFHARGTARDAFFAAPMENMPDVAAIEKNPALRADLLAFLRKPAVLAAVDQGTLMLPERFLATRAVSVSPRGLTRSANRPFRKLFQDSDFADLSLSATRTLRSPRALLRRLDGASCPGCHQSRTLAGFHWLGEDAPEHPVFDALLSGASVHLESDLERRRAYVASVAADRVPDEFRPIPERQGVGTGFGAPCGLGDVGFADWQCAQNLRCERLEDSELGTCLGSEALGAPCQYGEVVTQARPDRDRVAAMKSHACDPGQRCDNNRSGFPLGACAAACSAGSATKVCADFLDADAFQNCLRARKTFGDCAQKHVFGAGLRACDAENPCRQDYVCVRSQKPGVGACVPPYFVYQLRLDGYPLLR